MPTIHDVANVFRDRQNVALQMQIVEMRKEIEFYKEYPMLWSRGEAADSIPDDDMATAYVLFGESHCNRCQPTDEELEALKKSFQSIANDMSPRVIISKERDIELPCSILRRWMLTENVWKFMPHFRQVENSCVYLALGDECQQPEGVGEFWLIIFHNYPTNAMLH